MIRRNRQMNRAAITHIWQRIIFDPLSYIHPQRLQIAPEMIVRPAARAAANELIPAAWRLKNGESECIQNSLDAAVAASVAPTAASKAYLPVAINREPIRQAQGAFCFACRIGRASILAMHQGTSLSVCTRRRITGFTLASGMHS